MAKEKPKTSGGRVTGKFPIYDVDSALDAIRDRHDDPTYHSFQVLHRAAYWARRNDAPEVAEAVRLARLEDEDFPNPEDGKPPKKEK